MLFSVTYYKISFTPDICGGCEVNVFATGLLPVSISKGTAALPSRFSPKLPKEPLLPLTAAGLTSTLTAAGSRFLFVFITRNFTARDPH